MSWDVHKLRCIFVLIATSLSFYQGDCKCVTTSSTRLCRESCPDSASESCPQRSCSKECIYCKLGYYGPLCSRRCKGKSHCLHDNCALLPSGRALNCSEGCRQGWRGLSCNTNCKHPCLECNRFNGECVGRCREGYFGQGCSERCDENCLECEKESGKCTYCMKGFYGGNCTQPCSEVCEQCDQISGECVSGESLKSHEDPVTMGNDVFDSITYDDEDPSIKKIGNRNEDSSHSFNLNLSGALIGVVFILIIIIIIISTLLRKRKHKSHANSLSAQESTLSESYKPLTSSDPDHIYDEIQDVSKKPLFFDNHIILTQHHSSHDINGVTYPIHSSKNA